MKLSMSTKIFFGSVTVMIAFGAVLVFSIARFHSMSARFQQVGETYLALSRLASQIETAQGVRRSDVARVLEIRDPALRSAIARHTREGFRRVVWDKIRFAQTTIDKGISAGTLDERWAREVSDRLTRVEKLSSDYEETAFTMFSALEADGAAQVRDDPLRDIDQGLARELRLLSGLMETRISSVMQEASREESAAIWWIIFWSVIALGVAVTMLVFSFQALSPLADLRLRLARIARGDYTPGNVIDSDDEIGRLSRAVDEMTGSLSQREREIAETGEKLIRVTAELRRANANELVLRTMNENIFRSIRLAIIALDEHGRVANFNPAAEVMWGLGGKEITGKPLIEIAGWNAILGSGELPERVMIRRETVNLESVRLDVGDGPLFDLVVTPLVGESGELRGALVIGEDVTDKVRTKQQLIQSERLAAIGRLAAQVTHEVRNPLSTIGLNAELLEETLSSFKDPEATRLLTAIQREIGRLTEITEEYLRLSRPSQGKPRPVDLNEILDDVAEFVVVEFMRQNIGIRRELSADLASVNADPNRLRQVFMNIMRNAFESMPSGGVLTIRTRDEGGAAVVEISDTGQGIDPDVLPHLFELFYSTKETGFGLGLALAKQFVGELGGQIGCSSEKGRGSMFTVTLPAAEEQESKGA